MLERAYYPDPEVQARVDTAIEEPDRLAHQALSCILEMIRAEGQELTDEQTAQQ